MSRRKPVVLFCAALDADGVARNTVRLANALARRGEVVEVVTLRGGALSHDLAGPNHVRLGAPRSPRALALAGAVPALRRRLREIDPALAISMGNHAHLAMWAALRGFGDLPRIYRISNDPDHGASLRKVGLRLVADDATRLICVSSRAARGPVFRRARRDRRLHVVPNGVDVADIRTRARAPVSHPWLDDGRPYIAAVGRVHEQKNYDGLVDALALARAQGRADLRLLIMGRAPDTIRRMLVARAHAAGVAEAVRFEGEVANPFPLLSRAAVYALPSRWEGASNSLLEALACGVPTVAARTAGNAPEVLAEGRYGRLAEARDPADLAKAILLQSDPKSRVLPGDRANCFAVERATEAALRVVGAALGEHDEIQMGAAGGLNPWGVSEFQAGGP